MTTLRDPLYVGYRYPGVRLSYAVWLYFRFPLSPQVVEVMLAARGIGHLRNDRGRTTGPYWTIENWNVRDAVLPAVLAIDSVTL
jgi:transposase-like protein